MPQDPKNRPLTPEEIDAIFGSSYDSGVTEDAAPTRRTPYTDHPWLRGGGALLARVLGGVVSGIPALAPGIGSAKAAAIGGGAEALAQKIESPDPLDKSTISIEGGLSMIPFNKVYRYGKPMLGNVLRGMGLMESGNVLRRWDAGENPLPDTLGEGLFDLGTMGIGGLGGAAISRKTAGMVDTPPSVDPNATPPPSRVIVDPATGAKRIVATPEEAAEYRRLVNAEYVEPSVTEAVMTRKMKPIGDAIAKSTAAEVKREAAKTVQTPSLPSFKEPPVTGSIPVIRRVPTQVDENTLPANAASFGTLEPASEGMTKWAKATTPRSRPTEVTDTTKEALTSVDKAGSTTSRISARNLRKRNQMQDAQQQAKNLNKRDEYKAKEAADAEEAARVAEAQAKIDALLESGAAKVGPRVLTETTEKVPTASGNQVLRQTIVEKTKKEGIEGADDADVPFDDGPILPPQSPRTPATDLASLTEEYVKTNTFATQLAAMDAAIAIGKKARIIRLSKGKWRVKFVDEQPTVTPAPKAPDTPVTAAPETPQAPPPPDAPPPAEPTGPVVPKTPPPTPPVAPAGAAGSVPDGPIITTKPVPPVVDAMPTRTAADDANAAIEKEKFAAQAWKTPANAQYDLEVTKTPKGWVVRNRQTGEQVSKPFPTKVQAQDDIMQRMKGPKEGPDAPPAAAPVKAGPKKPKGGAPAAAKVEPPAPVHTDKGKAVATQEPPKPASAIEQVPKGAALTAARERAARDNKPYYITKTGNIDAVGAQKPGGTYLRVEPNGDVYDTGGNLVRKAPKPVTPQLKAPGSDSMAPAGSKTEPTTPKVTDEDVVIEMRKWEDWELQRAQHDKKLGKFAQQVLAERKAAKPTPKPNLVKNPPSKAPKAEPVKQESVKAEPKAEFKSRDEALAAAQKAANETKKTYVIGGDDKNGWFSVARENGVPKMARMEVHPSRMKETPAAPKAEGAKPAVSAAPIAAKAETPKEIVAYDSMPNDAVPNAVKAIESLGFTNVRVEAGEHGSKIFAVPPTPKPPFVSKGTVEVDLSKAKTATDVQKTVIKELNDYLKRVEADDLAAGIKRGADSRPDIIRGIAAKGVPPLPNPAKLVLKVPNGPTIYVDSPEQATKLIEQFSKAKGTPWQGIVDKVKRTKPQYITNPPTSKATIASKADADELMLKNVDITEHDSIVGPTANKADFTPTKATIIRKIGIDEIPKEANIAIVATEKGKTVILVSDDKTALTLVGKEHLGLSKPNIQELPEGKTFKESIEKFAARDKIKPEDIKIGTVGMDNKPIKPIDPPTEPPPTAPAPMPKKPKGGSPSKGAAPIVAKTEAPKGKAPLAESPKAEASDKKPKGSPKAPAKPKLAEDLKPVDAKIENKDLAKLAEEEKTAWDKYWDLKAAFNEGKATNEEIRAAGKAAGEIKAQVQKMAREALDRGEAIPAYIKVQAKPTPKAKPDGKGPTSDEISALPPEEQEAALKKIADEFKKKKGRLKNQKGQAQIDMMLNMGVGTIGAIFGAASTPDDPLIGGALGLFSGIAAPTAYKFVSDQIRSGKYTPAKKAAYERKLAGYTREQLKNLFEIMPDAYRSFALSSGNLPINMFVGPYGGAVMGAIESILAGDKRGWKVLQDAGSFKFPKDVYESIDEAGVRIHQGTERVEFGDSDVWPGLRKWLEMPAKALTAGDIAGRKLLMGRGYSEPEARSFTLTSEPFSGVGAAVGNARKSKGRLNEKQSWLMKMALPFYRTKVNQLEQGAIRIPIIGPMLADYWNVAPLNVRQEIAQAALSMGMGFAGYALAKIVPPEQHKTWLKVVNNFGGVYGLQASVGFTLGVAETKGDPWSKRIQAAARSVIMDAPLPTTDMMHDLVNAGYNAMEGKPITLPYGFVPPFLSSRESMSIPTLMRDAGVGSKDGLRIPEGFVPFNSVPLPQGTKEERSILAPFVKTTQKKAPRKISKGERAVMEYERKRREMNRKDRP